MVYMNFTEIHLLPATEALVLKSSNRGSGLKILFYIGERENILQCFKNSRMAIGKPLHEQLSSRKYSKIDEQLLRSTAMQLELKDPYLANGGI